MPAGFSNAAQATIATGVQSEPLGASSLRLSFGCALVFHSPAFLQISQRPACRKCYDHWFVCVAYSYLKSGPVLGYNVCVHAIHASRICGL